MARFTLSIADDVAAQLDAYAAENNLNRSQAAEQIFRNAFQAPPEVPDQSSLEDPRTSANSTMIDVEYLTDRLLEVQDYLTRVCSAHTSLHHFVISTTPADDAMHSTGLPRGLPTPPWARGH